MILLPTVGAKAGSQTSICFSFMFLFLTHSVMSSAFQSLISTSDLPRSLLEPARLLGFTPHIVSTADPRVSYALYIPVSHYPVTSSNSANTSTTDQASLLPLVVVLHGTTRQTTPLLTLLQPFADRASRPFAILAPLFPGGMNGPDDWDSYRIVRPALADRPGIANPLHADTALLAMLDVDVPARWPGLDTSRVVLFGFSGGASSAQRLALLYPERLHAVSLAAPGSLTLLPEAGGGVGERKWPDGVQDIQSVFEGRGVGDLGLVKGGWQLVVGDNDTALEGSLEGIDRVVREWGKNEGESWEEGEKEGVDWVALLRVKMKPRREVLGEFAEGLRARGIHADVEIVEGGKHVLDDVIPNVGRFVSEVVGKLEASGR